MSHAYRRLERWLESGRDPTPEERRPALGQPTRFVLISWFWWTLAAVAVGYLLAERIASPVTALALARERRGGRSLEAR